MGWYYLPLVGSQYGPCVPNEFGDCKHRACECTRQQFRAICKLCGKAIGEGARVYFGPKHELTHARCEETAEERRRTDGRND